MDLRILVVCCVAAGLCLAPSPGTVWAADGTGRIEGVVKTMDARPLVGATVAIPALHVSVLTDNEGRFVLDDLPPGRIVTLEARYGDRLRREMTVHVVRGTRVVELLFEVATRTEEVSVEVETPRLQAADQISGVSLSPDQIAILPSLGEKDIFRGLQLLPGVSGSHESSSGLYVRGGTPSQSQIAYDGFTVYHVDHLYGYFSAFNMEAVDQVHLSKSAFDPRDGGRLAGVLDLTGKSGRRDRPGTRLGVSLLSFHGLVETPLGPDASLLVAGRRSFQGPLYDSILDMFASDSGGRGGGPAAGRPGGPGGFALFESEPSSHFYDVNAKLLWEPSTDDRVSLSVYGGRDLVDNSRSLEIPAEMRQRMAERGFDPPQGFDISDAREWDNRGVGFQWQRSWGRGFTTRASAGFSSFEESNDRGTQAGDGAAGNVEENDLEDLTARLELTAPLHASNSLEIGVVATRNTVAYHFESSTDAQVRPGFAPGDARPQWGGLLDRDQEATQLSAYALDRWAVSRRVLLTPGIRVTRYDATQETFVEPRASVQIQLTDRFRLKGAWGLQHQFANRVTREDAQGGNREFWTLSDGEDVPVARARQAAAGISYETKGILVDIEGFRKDLSGLALFEPQLGVRLGDEPTVPDLATFFYQGEATAEGVELLLQKKLGSHTGWVSYTLSKVDQVFPELEPDPFPASHDRRHELKIVDSVRHGHWTFSGTWILASGAAYTEAAGLESIAIGEEFVFDRVVLGGRHAARLPAYHRLDLAAHYDFDLGPGQATLGVSGFNLYDRSNVWYRELQALQGEIVVNDILLMGRTFNVYLSARF